MKITPEFIRLHSGESNSRILSVSIDKEHEGKKVKLGFITPMGKIYITDELKLSDNTCQYSIPHMLLDGKGMLLTQLIVYENEDFVIKSPIEEYPVFSSVDDMSAPTVSDESLKSLAMIFDILLEKSDVGHIHDDLYYTENEVNALLSCKSDTDHKHEGVYLTKEELEGLLPESEGTVFQHNHDNRYYTENEIDGLLSEKQDKLPLTDYVVEQGISGNWTYRKWASGIAECWSDFGHWGERVSNQSIRVLAYNSAFPFAFTAVPNVTAGVSLKSLKKDMATGEAVAGEYVEYQIIRASASKTHLEEIALLGFSPTEERIFEGICSVSVKGRWK
ncbi:MAG: hypothetical protein IKL10_06820 [Clostridia bacterium]|nr:hypothetical protein [Clostridia bacterium]